jgi:predicted lipoprotein with Yx(FWY)xxD motif
MTIYAAKQEANGTIKCTSSCLNFWLPVTGSASAASASGLPGKLATIHRSDNGMTQLTYNGQPLYTFKLDTGAGQSHGNNFSDSFGGTSFNWVAVTTSGQAGGAGSPTPSSSSSSSGYGY